MTEAILKTSQKNGYWIQEMSNDGEVFSILNSIFIIFWVGNTRIIEALILQKNGCKDLN